MTLDNRRGAGARGLGRRAVLRILGAIGGVLTSAPSRGKTEGQSGAEDKVWTGFFNTHELFGFVGRHSVRVGEALPIMLSRKPGAAPLEGMLRFYRIGAYPFGRKLAWASPVGSVRAYPVLRSAAAVGVAWPAFVMADTSAWEPGCYTADFHAVGRDEPYYDLVQAIVRPPKPRGDMLLKLSTNTWQAYNPWGGHSLYPDGDDPDADERGALVSFDRPTPAAFFEYEGFLVRWLEEVAGKAGFSVDYAANFDVHSDPETLSTFISSSPAGRTTSIGRLRSSTHFRSGSLSWGNTRSSSAPTRPIGRSATPISTSLPLAEAAGARCSAGRALMTR